MSRLTRTASALLGAAGILVAMVYVAPVALAQNISITSAGPDSSNDPYDLTVVASDGNGLQISTMVAHVFSSGTEIPGSPFTMAYASGTPGTPYVQTWTASPAIPQADLPPGTYTVTVDATDSLPETDNGLPAPGSFSFSYTTTLTAAASPTTVTQGSQTVTFSGNAMGAAPGGTAVPIVGAPVYLNGVSTGISTDSSGNFSYTPSGNTQPGDYTVSVNGTGTYSGASANVTVGAVAAPTTMSVTAVPTSVAEGSQSVTFSGTVTAGSPTAVPVVGAPVDLSINGGALGQVATTDSSGNFSYPAPGNTQPGDYTFSVSAAPLYSADSYEVTVGANVAQTAINVTADPDYVTFGSPSVLFSGTVTGIPSGSSTAVPISNAPVFLNGSTTSFTTTDSNGKFTYSPSGNPQAGTYTFSVDQSTLYTAATDPVQVPLDPAVTNLAVTANPPDVDLGSSTVTFSGTLTGIPQGSTTPVPIPGALVLLNGSSTGISTDSNGNFTDVITGITQAADYNFSVDAGTLYGAATDDVPIGLQQEQSNLAVTANPTSISEGSQTVNFSGTLTGVSPNQVNIQNAPVDLSINGGTPTQVAMTSSAGTFTYNATGVANVTDYKFSVIATSTYSAATYDVPVGVSPALTRITGIGVSPAHLKYGQKATLTGTVQYLLGTTWTALPATLVHLAEGTAKVGSATTGSNGAFSASLPSTNGNTWSATVSAGTLIQQATAIGTLSIAVPLKLKSFAASLGADGYLDTSGCLQVTVPVNYGPQTTVEIQYSPGKRGPWKILGKLHLRNNARQIRSCRGATESYFSADIRAKLADAYYRANFPANYSFQGVVSQVINSWRYQTRITSFNVSPRVVSHGQVATITGRLQVRGKSSWKAFAHQKIYVCFMPVGVQPNCTTMRPKSNLGTVRTNSGGYFTTTAIGGSGNFVVVIYAQYAADAKHLDSQTRGINVSNKNGGHAGPVTPIDIGGPPVEIPVAPLLEGALLSISSLLRE